MWEISKKENWELDRRWNEERLANKRTNKSSYSSSCSSSDIWSYICSDKTLSTLYCSPILIPTATLSPPINYSASISYLIFFFLSKWWLRWLSFCYTAFLSRWSSQDSDVEKARLCSTLSRSTRDGRSKTCHPIAWLRPGCCCQIIVGMLALIALWSFQEGRDGWVRSLVWVS